MNAAKLTQLLQQGVKVHLASDYEKAEAIYQEILKYYPEHPDALHLLGLIRGEEDQNDEAIRLIEQAMEIKPDAAPFWHNIAGIYRRVGRLDEARAAFRKAIELKADYGEAYQGLAEMEKWTADDPFITRVETQLRSVTDKRIASYLHFAAGIFYDRTAQYNRAFEHFRLGNELTGRQFDNARFRQQVKETIYTWSPTFVRNRLGRGLTSEVPVFVLGMPRSGSTLIEQILSSHSQIYGAGELNDLKQVVATSVSMTGGKILFPHNAGQLTASQLSALATAYLERLQAHDPDGQAARIVDKHPMNFQFVGLILTLFPNAKVIHSIRHPLDTCLSTYFQNFTKGQDYSFNLEALAHFYVDYRRLMEHWEMLYPDSVLTVSYDQLIENQELETRRML
ncbi:MAG: sulfotransferase, partial [Pseudomonadales bacterium]|nr:sulfotransferase [Pseudomonadales bacterium]